MQNYNYNNYNYRDDKKNQEFLDSLQDNVYADVEKHPEAYSLETKSSMTSAQRLSLVGDIFGIFATSGLFCLIAMAIKAWLYK